MIVLLNRDKCCLSDHFSIWRRLGLGSNNLAIKKPSQLKSNYGQIHVTKRFTWEHCLQFENHDMMSFKREVNHVTLLPLYKVLTITPCWKSVRTLFDGDVIIWSSRIRHSVTRQLLRNAMRRTRIMHATWIMRLLWSLERCLRGMPFKFCRMKKKKNR